MTKLYYVEENTPTGKQLVFATHPYSKSNFVEFLSAKDIEFNTPEYFEEKVKKIIGREEEKIYFSCSEILSKFMAKDLKFFAQIIEILRDKSWPCDFENLLIAPNRYSHRLIYSREIEIFFKKIQTEYQVLTSRDPESLDRVLREAFITGFSLHFEGTKEHVGVHELSNVLFIATLVDSFKKLHEISDSEHLIIQNQELLLYLTEQLTELLLSPQEKFLVHPPYERSFTAEILRIKHDPAPFNWFTTRKSSGLRINATKDGACGLSTSSLAGNRMKEQVLKPLDAVPLKDASELLQSPDKQTLHLLNDNSSRYYFKTLQKLFLALYRGFAYNPQTVNQPSQSELIKKIGKIFSDLLECSLKFHQENSMDDIKSYFAMALRNDFATNELHAKLVSDHPGLTELLKKCGLLPKNSTSHNTKLGKN